LPCHHATSIYPYDWIFWKHLSLSSWFITRPRKQEQDLDPYVRVSCPFLLLESPTLTSTPCRLDLPLRLHILQTRCLVRVAILTILRYLAQHEQDLDPYVRVSCAILLLESPTLTSTPCRIDLPLRLDILQTRYIIVMVHHTSKATGARSRLVCPCKMPHFASRVAHTCLDTMPSRSTVTFGYFANTLPSRIGPSRVQGNRSKISTPISV